jgi:hypothetical protein
MTSKPVPTVDDFEKLVGETFQLSNKRFKLASVIPREAPGSDLPKGGSLVFEAEDGTDTDISSGTHLVSHSGLGDHLLYIERVSAEDDPAAFELILG